MDTKPYLCDMSRKRKKVVLEMVPVTDYAAEGKSLSRIDGKVVFIEGGAVPGDVVDVRLFKNKKDWAAGKVTAFQSYSPQRVTPFCQHFDWCGGCKWQMLPYEKQLQYKQQQVEDTLAHIGKLDLPEINPILGAATTKNYRNKLEFTFSNKAYLTAEEIEAKGWEQRNALGFHIPKMFDKILDIETCYLQQEPSNAIRNEVRRFAQENNYAFYDLRAHTGWLRNLIIRISTLGEVMVNLCVRSESEHLEKIMAHLKKSFPGLTTLLYTINDKKNDSIHDLEPVVYEGPGYIREKLGKYTFRIGPKSFFQTNTRQAEVLYDVAKRFAGLTGQEVVYDLYCGTGSIGIYLSDNAKSVVGVELIGEAVRHAKQNADLNGIKNATFYEGDVLEVCNDDFFNLNGRPDVVITDPPRAGMHNKLVAKLMEIAAPKIVYVSCNPATQARDLLALSEKYVVKAVQPVDLFPHTHHIENVVMLERRKE